MSAPTGASDKDLDSALGAISQLDYDGAARMLDALARAGDPKAQAALATLIESGNVATDYPETPIELLQKAAAQGMPEAALELGNRHYRGRGVARDITESLSWWRRAAEAGSNRAAYNLGVTYLEGNFVPADPVAARTWLRQAVGADTAAAWFALGVAQLRDEPGTPAYAAACESFTRAAAAGDTRAQYNLGAMYERGIACANDPATAIEAYRRAAAAGNARAATALERLTGATSRDPVIHENAWVLRQNAGHYTLQIANGANEKAIVEILERHDATIDRAWFRIESASPPRFVALVGVFESYLDALAYLNALPPTLTRTKPWIRRFGSLHDLSRD